MVMIEYLGHKVAVNVTSTRQIMLRTCLTNIKSDLNPLRAKFHVRFLAQGVSKLFPERIQSFLALNTLVILLSRSVFVK
jgi:hypothetical protein